VQEECDALAAIPPAKRIFDPEDYLRMKGAKELSDRDLAVLRELFIAREDWAHEAGRPPFKVLGTEVMVGVAAGKPRRLQELSRIPGCSPKVIQRYGERILAAIARGEAVPKAGLPTFPRGKKPRVPPAVQRRIEALTRWRARDAERLRLDPGLLLPRRLIEQLAEQNPADRQALSRLEGLRRWRIETFGVEILEVLASAAPEPERRGGG
jgi:ribonuclease D